MFRLVAAVFLCVLVFYTGTGCNTESVDPDRISQANKVALEFLGKDRSDLVFTGKRNTVV